MKPEYYFIFFLFFFIGQTNANSLATLPELNWIPCFEQLNRPFECAVAKLPLNHQREEIFSDTYVGEIIQMPLLRIPAQNPEEKIGTLFINPGGPGGSGIDFVRSNGHELYSDTVRARYDIIGFDPRGVARTSPLRCFNSFFDYFDVVSGPEFPVNDQEVEDRLARNHLFREACRLNAGNILHHMSTADVARDLDILRQYVGDEKLNFVGYSYGSFLATTYANLFPDKTGRIILDGVIEPQEWVSGEANESFLWPVSMRLQTGLSANRTLNEFFRLCDQQTSTTCAFSGNSKQRFDAIANTLETYSLQMSEQAIPIHLDEFISSSLSYLYNSADWKNFATFLLAVENRLSESHHAPAFNRVALSDRAPGETSNLVKHAAGRLLRQTVEAYPGVACADTDNPLTATDWINAANEAQQKNGFLAKLWTWNESVCMDWPGSNASRYAGPFTARTDSTLLIMNTRFDPATPYHGALNVRNTMVNSKLVTVEGWGHTTLYLSDCATNIASHYLVTGEAPIQDEFCAQDLPVFADADQAMGQGQGHRFDAQRKRSQARQKFIDMLYADGQR